MDETPLVYKDKVYPSLRHMIVGNSVGQHPVSYHGTTYFDREDLEIRFEQLNIPDPENIHDAPVDTADYTLASTKINPDYLKAKNYMH